MKKFCTLILFALGVFPGGYAFSMNWESASNVLALSMPAIAGAYTWNQQDQEGGYRLAQTLASTLGATMLLKSQVDAPRPDASGHDSFPSGHTAIAFASARYLQKRYGEDVSPVALYGVAGLTALARVRADKHYWRDTVAGAALGYVAADWFTQSRSGDGFQLWPVAGGVAMVWQRSLK